MDRNRIAVVIPCYKVKAHVLEVLAAIPDEVDHIFVVDDACPEGSGQHVESHAHDPRIRVLHHERNGGVGAAVMTGYRAALEVGARVVVKIDGDNQMDPRLIPRFVAPLLAGEADYTKGNRFHSLYNLRKMPRRRLIGNAALGFLTKLSSGYWKIFDPTNGYTAIDSVALRRLELRNIAERYFFESDMLINLGGIRAVIQDVPMEAVYGEEVSNLRIANVLPEFFRKNAVEFGKRILYAYFLRDFNLASLHLLCGLLLLLLGGGFGVLSWWQAAADGVPATAGTVMIATLPLIIGFQLVLSFFAFDIQNQPTTPLQKMLCPDGGLP